MSLVWDLANLLQRHLCMGCHGVIWPWQERHAAWHAACNHANARRLWTRATTEYGYDVAQWPCDFCGVTP